MTVYVFSHIENSLLEKLKSYFLLLQFIFLSSIFLKSIMHASIILAKTDQSMLLESNIEAKK